MERNKNFKKIVLEAKKHIKRGDIYELNYCQEFFSENADINSEALFCRLNKKAKAPFSAFLSLEDKYLICSSPERFLRKDNQKLS